MIDDEILNISRLLTRSLPEDLQEPIRLSITLCIREPREIHRHDVVTLERSSGSGISVKSPNAFLDWRKLLHTLSSLTLEGYVAYQIPILFIPAALKMLIDSRKLVEVELDDRHAAILLAIHKLYGRHGKPIPASDAFKFSQIIAGLQPYLIDIDEGDFRRIVGELERIGIVSVDRSGQVSPVEKVEIRTGVFTHKRQDTE